MNKRDARGLLERILDIIPRTYFLDAFNDGIQKYRRASSGDQVISEYFQTNYKEREFSTAIFDAFYHFDWSDPRVRTEKDTQVSSCRARLRVAECMIDIVKDGRMESKFYEDRFRLNRRPGSAEKRYSVLRYWVTEDHEIDRMDLIVPRTKDEVVASVLIYPEEN